MAADVSDLVSFDEFITHWAADRPQRIAMREEARLFTSAELEERTARVASALRAAGVEKGDRIAWIGKNSDLYFTLFFGAARAGIVMAPIGWRLSPVEWAYIINDTRAKIVFTGPGFDAVPDQLAGKLDHAPRIVGDTEARALIEATPRAPFTPSGPDDAVLQLYTSGTTGTPKGVPLTHANLYYETRGGQEVMNISETEVVLSVLPLFHVFAQVVNLWVIASIGGTIYYVEELTPAGLEKAFKTQEITLLTGVPRIWYLFHKKINMYKCKDFFRKKKR